jgi:HEAT repeat protein
VLSQRHEDAAIDGLIDVARHDPDSEIRKRAMFWLGQTKEPRAIKFLQDILTR